MTACWKSALASGRERTRSVVDSYLLDTSAVMTYLEDEDGSDRIEEIVTTQRTLLPFVAALEVHYITIQEQGAVVAEERLAALKALPLVWLNTVDEATLIAAARFRQLTGSPLLTRSWPGSRSPRAPSWCTKTPNLTHWSAKCARSVCPTSPGRRHLSGDE